jgi:hypothetical protein
MKMRRVSVRWEKVVEVMLYVPEDMLSGDIRSIAQEAADDIDRYGWEADWATILGRVEDVDVPDEECRVTTQHNRFGRSYADVVAGSRLAADDAMVISDDRDELVNPTDATWWVVPAQEKP